MPAEVIEFYSEQVRDIGSDFWLRRRVNGALVTGGRAEARPPVTADYAAADRYFFQGNRARSMFARNFTMSVRP